MLQYTSYKRPTTLEDPTPCPTPPKTGRRPAAAASWTTGSSPLLVLSAPQVKTVQTAAALEALDNSLRRFLMAMERHLRGETVTGTPYITRRVPGIPYVTHDNN